MVLPGGDPDAGMPAEQAEIHGTERGPPLEEPERYPIVTDSLDNIDDVDQVDNNDGSNVTHPPDSD